MKLRCVQGPLAGRVIELPVDAPLIFGREESSIQGHFLLLPSGTVSRKHGEIRFEEDKFWIRDLKSSNGIRVNRQKILDQEIKAGDVIQVGEFTFQVLGGTNPSTKTLSEATGKKSESQSQAAPSQEFKSDLKKHKWVELKEKFEALDFRVRLLLVFGVFGFLIHILISSPIISEARDRLYRQSFEIAKKAVRSLGDRNKRELAEGSNLLLDCEFLRQSPGVKSAFLFDAKGKIVCPIGGQFTADGLLEAALYRGESVDDCTDRVIYSGEPDCDFVFPIREWRDQQAQYVIVGAARIQFEPKDAEITVQNLRSLAIKSLVLTILILLGLWYMIQFWVQKAVQEASDAVHLAVTGTVQTMEHLRSFTALDPLIQEVNKLISKSNQGLGESSGSASSEASFLHSLFQQVLLLEERPVMVVDKENHILAMSVSLPELIPVDAGGLLQHITDAVGDSHLQAELMGLLNDLSQGADILDRALSMSDRVVQARGMPLFSQNEYVASILVF